MTVNFTDGPSSPDVTLQVVVSDGEPSHDVTRTIDVHVANVAPTVAFTAGSTSVNESSAAVSYSYSISDPGNDTVQSVSVDCGSLGTSSNASHSNTSGSFDCTFPDGPVPAGTSTVSVQATDSDGGAGNTANRPVTVNNVAPTVAFTAGSTSVNESSAAVSYSYSISDPGNDTVQSVSVDCGSLGTSSNASHSNTSGSFDCTFPDGPVPAGTSTVSVQATDSDGGAGNTANRPVTVNNVAPTVDTVSVTGAGAACLGGNPPVGLTFTFHDPGVNDNNWIVDIDWDDGSHTPDSLAMQSGPKGPYTHTYAGPGVHTPKVTVRDKDGTSGNKSATTGAGSFLYNMSAILPPFNPDGSSVWKYGSTIPVKVRITDCAGNAVSTLKPKIGTSLDSSAPPSAPVDEAMSTSSADTDSVMRFDSTAGQYIYNYATKTLADSNATYYMYVRGTDANGVIVTNPAQVSQKFGIKTK